MAFTPSLPHHMLAFPSPPPYGIIILVIRAATLHLLRQNNSISCNKSARTLRHSCQLGKHVRLPFGNSSSVSSLPFELIHCDVRTSPVASISGAQYYLVILVDFTHFCWTFPLVHKSKVAPRIINFCAFVQHSSAFLSRLFRRTTTLSSLIMSSRPSLPPAASTYDSLLSLYLPSKRQG